MNAISITKKGLQWVEIIEPTLNAPNLAAGKQGSQIGGRMHSGQGGSGVPDRFQNKCLRHSET